MPHGLQVAIDFMTLPVRPDVFTIPAFNFGDTIVGPLSLRWYSLGYIAGIMFSWWMLMRMMTRTAAPLSREQVDGFISWATLGVILGGRLGYVLFYNLQEYLAHPINIVRVWDGGMSFHGGALGVIIAVFAFGAANRISGLRFLDYIAVTAPFGIGVVRLANFANGRALGSADGQRLGDHLPQCRPRTALPVAAVRSGTGGRDAVRRADVAVLAHRCPAASRAC